MTETYYQKLLHPLWRHKREDILHRDGYACIQCGGHQSLHVHHEIYVYGREPWEYNDTDLATLCSACHEKLHERNNERKWHEAFREQEGYSGRFVTVAECLNPLLWDVCKGDGQSQA